jgi:hypothetical protein
VVDRLRGRSAERPSGPKRSSGVLA